MKIVIAGAGEVGSHLAKMLSVENHEIIVIDLDPRKLEILSNHYDLMTIEGDATSIKTLTDVGIKKTDLFVAVTPDDSRNIAACLLASKLGAEKTIARVDNDEYVDPQNRSIFDEIGIHSLISPETLAARGISESLRTSWQRVNMSFGNDELILIGIKLRFNAPILNKQFKTGFMDHARFRVVAIKRGMDTIIPEGHDQLLDGDTVFVITMEDQLEFVREQTGKINRSIRNVMIMGGSQIGIKTAQNLPEKVTAKIIELDYEQSVFVSEQVQDSLVIHGDGRDLDLLLEEGIRDVDAFVAVTGSSETNILACVAAKRLGIVKTIAEVENNDYIPMAQSLDIGTIINKKMISASYIYQMTLDASVLNVTYLPSSDAQVIEFEVHEGSKILRKKIRDLRIPEDVNFGGYIRNAQGHICSGNTQFEPGDHVVVFCQASSVHKIERLFNYD